MTTAVRELPPHGSLSRHKYHKCKCDTCFEGYRAYQRSRHRRKGYGTWEPYVDAEPIRQHLINLREQGISSAQVAAIAGLYTATVNGFLYDLNNNRPRKKRATREVAEKILAVTADQGMAHLVDSTGTRRRLQALARLGWPMKALGPHIGVNPATVNRLALQAHVYGRTAKAVTQCYEQLRNQKPEEHGVVPGLARRIRNWAEREGWRDPQWWEDYGHIDDPDFDPATADTELGVREKAALRREEIIHFAWHGDSPEQILNRLGGEVSISTVRQIVNEWRTGQKRDRKQAAAHQQAA
ncbi:hypothetical protein M2155_000657 [Streptomyces sp. SAI-119]|uniref:hypothetical protein n=1 Tax=Streptomyces sp. SAI-119 TaxID=2940541 RepID=UPI002474CD13|nr:hypothetical protein [Streptomyces sp. SAI-119]MDH6448249.1 hypothetical protein [Streptomyces sp. SAI-119]